MGLNDVFEIVRHQLLVMELVPSINKAYAIRQIVEKQKKVQMEIVEVESTALHIRQEMQPERSGMRPERKKI
ncbi:UNVERIFIED_CONTAM: hypothetical protein Sindi_2675600, partial [Sesamum indicum]